VARPAAGAASISAVATMPFGKHKGVAFTELDSGYLNWLASKLDEWRPPLRDAVEAEIARAPLPSFFGAGTGALLQASPKSVSVRLAGQQCCLCGLPSRPCEPSE
jgi:Putative quorum-sensing-regulated virulence factor